MSHPLAEIAEAFAHGFARAMVEGFGVAAPTTPQYTPKARKRRKRSVSSAQAPLPGIPPMPSANEGGRAPTIAELDALFAGNRIERETSAEPPKTNAPPSYEPDGEERENVSWQSPL